MQTEEHIKQNEHLLKTTPGILDVNIIQQREECISSCESLENELRNQLKLLSEFKEKLRGAHEKDMQTLAVITNKKKKEESSWTEVKTKQAKKSKAKKQEIAIPQPAKMRTLQIEGLPIDAIVIEDIAAATASGQLYYVKDKDLFVLLMCGVKLIGNIGRVYTSEKNPEKIKQCRWNGDENCALKQCGFYHPGKDIRNFMATSWLYVPPTSGYGDRFTRKVSSRDSLQADLQYIDSEYVALANNMLMHDILCFMIMQNHIKKASL